MYSHRWYWGLEPGDIIMHASVLSTMSRWTFPERCGQWGTANTLTDNTLYNIVYNDCTDRMRKRTLK